MLDNFVRGRRANLAAALPIGPGHVVEGDIRDVDARARADRGRRPRLPPGRDPDHPVRRGAAARPRGPGRRHVQRPRGRGRGEGRQGRRRVVGVGVRAGRGVPDDRAAPPVQQRHVLRRGEGRSTRACCAASTPCTGSTTSPCATSTCTARGWTSTACTPRCSSAGWSASRPGEPPLIFGDGPQTMDFVYTTDIARANLLAAESDVTDGVFNIGDGTETSLLELAEALLEVMGVATWRSSSARRARSTGSPGGWPSSSAAARAARFEAGGRPARPGCASWSTGGGARAAASAHDPRHEARGSARTRRRPRPTPSRSGWVAQGPRVAEFERRSPSASARRTASPSRPAPRRCTWRCTCSASARATRSSCRRSRSSPPPTARVYVGATPGVRRRRAGRPATSAAETVEPVLTAATRAVIAVAPGRRAGRRRAAAAAVRRAGASPWSRTPPAPPAPPTAALRSARGARSRPGRSTRASSSPPARAACSRRPTPSWPHAARRLREHGMSVTAADRHRSRQPVLESYLEVGFNYRMTDIQAAVGLVQLGQARRDGRAPAGAGRPLPASCSPTSPGCGRCATRPGARRTSSRSGSSSTTATR